MTEVEFRALSAHGYNRIPLTIEAFADLDTPLSLYLKLANKPYTFLLESVEGVPSAIATTLDGDYFVACGMDTVYFFAIARYLEYIVREQAKMVKMMKEDDMRGKGMLDKDGRRIATYPGAPDHPVNTCRLCGTPILEGRTLCNYCEMMQRKPPR
jgi:anthranilate/para-aminobenzoate synthase component I